MVIPHLDPNHFFSQILWFVIFFGLLYAVNFFCIIPFIKNKISLRQSAIKEALEKAEKATYECKKIEEEIDQIKAESNIHIAQMKRKAKIQSQDIIKEVTKQIKQDSKIAFEKMQQEFDQKTQKFEQEIPQIVTQLKKLYKESLLKY